MTDDIEMNQVATKRIFKVDSGASKDAVVVISDTGHDEVSISYEDAEQGVVIEIEQLEPLIEALKRTLELWKMP